MYRRQATLVAILGVILAACGASAQPSVTIQVSADSSPGASPSATVPPSPATVAVSPSPTPTQRPTARPTSTPVPAPPKPTGATFDEDVRCLDSDCNRAEFTQTVLWRAPRTKGVEVRVYGVTECLAMPPNPKPGASGPCLVEHTALPASVRRLLATAPASDGWVSWSWKQDTGCEVGPFSSDPNGDGYYAIVVAAYSATDHSIFAIAAAGGWYEPEPDEMIC